MFKRSVPIASDLVAFRTIFDHFFVHPQSSDGDANGARVQRLDVDRAEVGQTRGDEGRLQRLRLSARRDDQQLRSSGRRIAFIDVERKMVDGGPNDVDVIEVGSHGMNVPGEANRSGLRRFDVLNEWLKLDDSRFRKSMSSNPPDILTLVAIRCASLRKT